MSMHKIPLTDMERAGLIAHGLDVDKPSQLSDYFRHGYNWNKRAPVVTNEARVNALINEIDKGLVILDVRHIVTKKEITVLATKCLQALSEVEK